MRGRTSKGLFFDAEELPSDPAARDRLPLAALGSPGPFGRQLDGMGGGISSLSKAVVVGPSTRTGAPIRFVPADELGLDGTEAPDALEARPRAIAVLDRLRRLAGVLMGWPPSRTTFRAVSAAR